MRIYMDSLNLLWTTNWYTVTEGTGIGLKEPGIIEEI